MTRRAWVAGIALVLWTGWVAACGSPGGDDGAGSPDDGGVGPEAFQGSYFFQSLAIDRDPPTDPFTATSAWGTVNADGAGMQTGGTLTQNVEGVVGTEGVFAAFPYTVAAGRRITLNPGVLLEGGISADGSVLIAAMVSPTAPQIVFALRKGSGFDVRTLDGAYHICAFFISAGEGFSWWQGSVTFDGAGNATDFATGVSRLSAAPAPPGSPVPFGTYTVAGDGTVTWPSFNQGGLALGGELVVLSGRLTETVDAQSLFVLIKKGVGLNAGTLSGTYHVVDVRVGNSGSPLCFTGTAQADGAGLLTVQAGGTFNAGGTISVGTVSNRNYTVAPDGLLQITTVSPRTGAVSPTGRVAMYAGPTSAVGAVDLRLLIR